MDGFDLWIRVVSTVGFPIWVCWFVLTRLEKTMKDLTETIAKLTNAIEGKET